MLEKLNKTDKRNLALGINIGLILFYFLYFFVILQSSFSADDLFNANAAATNYMEGDSVWKLTVRQWKLWIENGRFYPFSNYTYLLFAALPGRLSYKALILVSVYVNSLLMSKCVRKLTGSESAGYMLMLVYPLSLQLSNCDDNAYYCFQLLVQVVMFTSELSLLATFRYIDTKNEKKSSYIFLILGALALLVALGTYEVAFIMAAFIGLGTWCYTGSVKNTLKILIPDIAVYIFMLIMNVVVRLMADNGDAYDGTAVNFALGTVTVTFLMALYATLPLARYLYDITHGAGWGAKDLLSALSLRDIVMVVVFVALLVVIVEKQEKERFKKNSNIFIFCMGLSLMIFPAMLISLMKKYQDELIWGFGQISAYLQNFGLALILLSLYMLIIRKCSEKVHKTAVVIVIVIAVPLMLVSQLVARCDVELKYSIYGYCRDTVLAAAKDGIFDEVKTKDYLFGTSDYIFDSADTKSFYTFAAKRELEGVESSNIAPLLIEKFGHKTTYDLSGNSDDYYAAYTYADAAGGFVVVGKVESATLEPDGASYDDLKVSDIRVYVTGEAAFDVSGWTLVSESNDGAIYSCTGTRMMSEFR